MPQHFGSHESDRIRTEGSRRRPGHHCSARALDLLSCPRSASAHARVRPGHRTGAFQLPAGPNRPFAWLKEHVQNCRRGEHDGDSRTAPVHGLQERRPPGALPPHGRHRHRTPAGGGQYDPRPADPPRGRCRTGGPAVARQGRWLISTARRNRSVGLSRGSGHDVCRFPSQGKVALATEPFRRRVHQVDVLAIRRARLSVRHRYPAPGSGVRQPARRGSAGAEEGRLGGPPGRDGRCRRRAHHGVHAGVTEQGVHGAQGDLHTGPADRTAALVPQAPARFAARRARLVERHRRADHAGAGAQPAAGIRGRPVPHPDRGALGGSGRLPRLERDASPSPADLGALARREGSGVDAGCHGNQSDRTAVAGRGLRDRADRLPEHTDWLARHRM